MHPMFQNAFRNLWITLLIAGLLGSLPLSNSARAEPPIEDFDCVIEPQQLVKLASPVVGVVAQLFVDRGDVVSEGQIVGKLEDGVEVARLALARVRAASDYSIKSAEARLNFLKRKHGRVD